MSKDAELDTEVESKSVANDIKSHTSAVADFTEQLNIQRTGRQRGQGSEDLARRPQRVKRPWVAQPRTQQEHTMMHNSSSSVLGSSTVSATTSPTSGVSTGLATSWCLWKRGKGRADDGASPGHLPSSETSARVVLVSVLNHRFSKSLNLVDLSVVTKATFNRLHSAIAWSFLSCQVSRDQLFHRSSWEVQSHRSFQTQVSVILVAISLLLTLDAADLDLLIHLLL